MPGNDSSITRGGCYCGAVRYEVRGALRGVVNCHCGQCTKLNGGFGAHAKAPRSRINITGNESLAWYRIAAQVRRGFCSVCGAGLFWDQAEQDGLAIIAGSIDQPTGLATIGHIFVGDKSDFYAITDNLPQFRQSSEGKLDGDYR